MNLTVTLTDAKPITFIWSRIAILCFESQSSGFDWLTIMIVPDSSIRRSEHEREIIKK